MDRQGPELKTANPAFLLLFSLLSYFPDETLEGFRNVVVLVSSYLHTYVALHTVRSTLERSSLSTGAGEKKV